MATRDGVIQELHIRGLGVIEAASLELAPGLTVVTGETGAGKTMLVTALSLLLGSRADASLVRAGEAAATVEAIVAPVPESAHEWAAPDDESLVVSREVVAEGRSRVRIGGRLAPVSALEEVLGAHVEVHAQHDHVRLARPEVQRRLLDRFAGGDHAVALMALGDTYEAWRALDERRRTLDAEEQERAREVDRLTQEVDDIAAAAIDPVRDATLDARIERAANAEGLRMALEATADALTSDAVDGAIATAMSALRRAPAQDPELALLRDRVAALATELADCAADARRLVLDLDGDGGPAELDALQARRSVLAALRRRHGETLEDVVEHGRAAAARLADLAALEEARGTIDAELDRAAADLRARASEVTAGRVRAAGRLVEVVDAHLADLGMPHARFSVRVDPMTDGAIGPDGADAVRFLLAANPGEPAVPIATAASGGERSRVSLAIEVALADVDDVSVLVFDEVDAGIGGTTALSVGEKLARLAHAPDRPRQVLCVTHLAQLAAFADVHHVVQKGVVSGRTVTTTRRVADDDRIGELSRMLGGEVTADAGLAHARELLEAARARTGR